MEREDALRQNLRHKDEVHVSCLDALDKGLLAVEAIGDDDEGEPRMDLSHLPDEPLSRIDLAVLLLMAVGVLYLFRGKGDHLALVGMYDGGLDDLMEKTVVSRKATGTVDLLG